MRIQLKDVTAGYGRQVIFRNLSYDFTIGRQPVAISGENGSGKSTLLKIFASVLRDVSGAISFAPSPPTRIAYAPPFATCLPWLSTHDNLALVSPEGGVPETAVASLDPQLLRKYGSLYPKQLSSGTKQKITLLQAILSLHRTDTPGQRLLLLDEPTRGLDIPSRDRLAALLRAIAQDDVAIVLVAHDPGFIRDIGAECRIDLERTHDIINLTRVTL